MTNEPASPPCYAHELDAETPRDIAGWRKAERARLVEARLAVTADARARVADDVAAALDREINPGPGMTISLYWPFKGELDLRDWMRRASAAGARIALPVVVAKAAPLVFREWRPGCAMTRGVWNIPIPAGGPEVVPDVTLAPLIGFDAACYRLGYGGGFYDRTLAALAPRPRVIGVGLPLARMPTIRPQPHDIPMDLILTGDGPALRR